MRIGLTDLFRHVSNPASLVLYKVGALNDVVLVDGVWCQVVDLFSVCLSFHFSTFRLCFVFLPHALYFFLSLFRCTDGANVHMDSRRAFPRSKGRIVGHVWLFMLAFHEMVGLAVGDSCTVDADATKCRRRRGRRGSLLLLLLL